MKIMNYSKVFLFGILSIVLAFSSCKKDEISQVEEVIPEVTPQTVISNPLVYKLESDTTMTQGLELGCFSVDFPFDVEVITGIGTDELIWTVISVSNFDDLESLFLNEMIIADFVYPIIVTYLDGTPGWLFNEDALGSAFASCIPDSGWSGDLFPVFLISDESSCYQMDYPTYLIDANGNFLTANNESQLIDLMATNEDLFFQFPVRLIDDDGSVLTVNYADELFELLVICDDVIDQYEEIPFYALGICGDFVYPINVMNQDGNTVVVNSYDELCNFTLNGLVSGFSFPLTWINNEGEEVVVNNMEELATSSIGCYVIIVEHISLYLFYSLSNSFFGECYLINYPINYMDAETEEITYIADEDAALDILSEEGYYSIVFPITIIEVETGNQVVLYDHEDYGELISNCE